MIRGQDKIHELYLEFLKKIQIPEFKEYSLERLLYNESYYAIEKNWWKVVKSLLRNFIVEDEFFVEDKFHDLLVFTVWYKRKDHDTNWNNFLELPIDKQQISFLTTKRFIGVRKSFAYIKDVWKYVRILKNIESTKHRIYLAIKLYELKRFKEWLECNIQREYKAACVFFDAGFYENLFIQYMKKKNALTVTLQHGQPVFRSWNYDRMNQSIILNFTSDIGICAGEFSKVQYLNAGFSAERLRVCGSLKNFKIRQYTNKERKMFSIFLDAPFMPNADEHNQKLIEIGRTFAHKYNILYGIKPHPKDQSDYSELRKEKRCCFIYGKECTLDEICENIEFGLFHASAIYVDMIERGIKPFRYKTEYYMPVTAENEEFSNEEEMCNLYSKWLECTDEEKKEFFLEKNRYYINSENAVEEHIKFFDEILKR